MNRHLSYFTGKRVWITGASSGIGYALADALGGAGVATLVSARRRDRLDALAARHASISVLELDLADRDSIADAAARAWDMTGGIDVLINNAGISQRSAFVEAQPAALERVINVDLLGTMRLTQTVAARMVTVGSGHICAVTSVAAKIPTPQRTAYAAAKAGVHALFDAMRGELEPVGITVSLAVPGYVNTEISTHALTGTGAEHGVIDRNQATGRSAESCAGEILRGLAKRKREFYVSMAPRIWLGLALRRVAPGLLWKTLAKARIT